MVAGRGAVTTGGPRPTAVGRRLPADPAQGGVAQRPHMDHDDPAYQPANVRSHTIAEWHRPAEQGSPERWE